jgi:hypothetical protein
MFQEESGMREGYFGSTSVAYGQSLSITNMQLIRSCVAIRLNIEVG